MEKNNMIAENEINKDEAIRQIKKVYHAGYDPNPDLSVWDQLFICESVAKAYPFLNTFPEQESEDANENVIANGSVNDSCKRSVNFESIDSKREAIKKLAICRANTSPLKVSRLLGELFIDYESKPGWWLFVAQHYTPRTINRVINRMLKLHRNGQITIKNPAAYFTYLIQYRKKRRFKKYK